MADYEYEQYVTTPENLKSKIEEYGVAIIPNILNESEIEDMKTGMWNTFEHITADFEKPIKKNDETSWKEFHKLYPIHSMLYQHWGVGHAQFYWNIRQNPKVINTFAKLWEVEQDELLTSFDGLSFHLPHEVTKRGYYRNNQWLHTDQSFTRNDFECVQSWITAYDVNEGDATLTFLEGSHKVHKDFAEKFSMKDKNDWLKLNKNEHYDYYINEKGCVQKCIKCPAGSMVFWDSRTIHSGREPDKNRENKNFRMIVYICMTPRSLAPPRILSKRINAFENKRLTTHWPHKGKLFGKNPRTYGADLPNCKELPTPELNDIGRKLVGY